MYKIFFNILPAQTLNIFKQIQTNVIRELIFISTQWLIIDRN